MILFLNGQFVPESEAKVSVLDRGFLYGDGLFEAVPVFNRKLFRWTAHFNRFANGAKHLKISLPCTPGELLLHAETLIEKNQLENCILRIHLSRGIGHRGYSPKGADAPTLVMSLHPIATLTETVELPHWRLITSTMRLPAGDGLNAFKNTNKLLQILARSEADSAQADDALLLNTAGQVAESSSGNIFWVKGDQIYTPGVETGILPGITRAVIIELCDALDIRALEVEAQAEALLKADGVFLTLSSRGVVEISHLDGAALSQSPVCAKLRNTYLRLVQSECQIEVSPI